jgi:hypothetical protein
MANETPITNALTSLKVLLARGYPNTLMTKEPTAKMRMIAVMMGSCPKFAKFERKDLTIPRNGKFAF